MHPATSPLYVAPAVSSASVLIGLAGLAFAMLSIVAFLVFVFAHDTKASVSVRDRPRRMRVAGVLAGAGAVAGVALLFTGGTIGFQQLEAEKAAHRTEIASWLHDEYGVTADTDDLVIDEDHPIAEIPATLDGHGLLVKLVPTKDGHLVALRSGDTPLVPVNR